LKFKILAGIYIHIPFCKQACNYCDFHFSTNLKNKADLVKGIVHEIKANHPYLKTKNIDSIYFGGGTPSLLSHNELFSIMNEIQKYFNWNGNCEITLEANPDDISASKLKSWQQLGINRLSIGLQSFNDEELKWMNRAHKAKESEACVKLAQDAGFKNISIDLIYGSKFQNLNSWEKTLQKALALKSQHISAYNLTIEGKTKLNNQLQKGLEPEVDDQLSSAQFEMMIDVFAENGFEQYEISNFAKKDFVAIHNTNYWFQKPYLGIGPSAHSYNGFERRWNIKSNAQYIQKIAKNEKYFEVEILSDKDKYNEFVLTRLRTKWGFTKKEIECFGLQAYQHFKNMVKNYSNELIFENETYSLNKSGKLMADKIASDLFLL